MVQSKKLGVFYSRKLVGTGGTRTLSVGKLLPTDWQLVNISVLKLEGKECILKIERLV